MKKICKMFLVISLAFSLSLIVGKVENANAATVENGYYIDNVLSKTMEEFNSSTKKDQKKYMKTIAKKSLTGESKVVIHINGQVYNFNDMVAVTDLEELAQISIPLSEYEAKHGELVSDSPQATFKVLSIE